MSDADERRTEEVMDGGANDASHPTVSAPGEHQRDEGPNGHITKFLDYYTDPSRDIPYAVLIEGPWGSGKTYFIKDYIRRFEARTERRPPVHLSLSGYEELSRIERGFAVATDTPPGMGMHQLLEGALKERALVFDDLERSSIPIDTILGYINNLVEHLGCKAIILAATNEITSDLKTADGSQDEAKADRFRRIKEKVIGKSFAVITDHEIPLHAFVDGLGCEDIDAELITSIKPVLLDVQARFESSNLRHLAHVVRELAWVLSTIPDAIKKSLLDGQDNDERARAFFVEIVRELAGYWLLVREGTLRMEDLDAIGTATYHWYRNRPTDRAPYTLRYRREGEDAPDPEAKFEERFPNRPGLLDAAKRMLLLWEDGLIGRTAPLDKEDWVSLLASFPLEPGTWRARYNRYLGTSQTPPTDWERLTHSFYALSDEEYLGIRERLHARVRNKTEKRLEVLATIFRFEQFLIERGMGDCTEDELCRFARARLRWLIAKEQIDLGESQKFDQTHNNDPRAWYGAMPFAPSSLDDVLRECIDFYNAWIVAKQQRELAHEFVTENRITDLSWLWSNLTKRNGEMVFGSAYVFLDHIEDTAPVFAQLDAKHGHIDFVRVLEERYKTSPELFRKENGFVSALQKHLTQVIKAGGVPSTVRAANANERIEAIKLEYERRCKSQLKTLTARMDYTREQLDKLKDA